MAGHSDEKIANTFVRTNGRCHICRKLLDLASYGTIGRAGSWEIDHSVARARGGTDRDSNLYAACVACNRSKQAKSTRVARAKHGHTAAPWSTEKREAAKNKNSVAAAVGGGLGAVLAGAAGPVAWLIAGGAYVVSRFIDPEP